MEEAQTRSGSVAAVILAAGRSSRMGHAKQVAVVEGTPMVVRAVTVALSCGADTVWVVTGAYGTVVEAVLSSLCQQHRQLHLLDNEAWATGQASSVQNAIKALPEETAAVLFLPVDQPFLPVSLLRDLIRTWRAGALLAAPAVDGQVRGAPAIFDRSLWPELLQLSGDMGARPLLQRHADQLRKVSAAATWLRDIDTPEELAAVNDRGARE
ncbi:MAG TPA: nucleotidyltransferase family protein [Caldilineaceae bacterium]|nr:nucleotidyltransferase family protein [Caldilineaceae bacterium]